MNIHDEIPGSGGSHGDFFWLLWVFVLDEGDDVVELSSGVSWLESSGVSKGVHRLSDGSEWGKFFFKRLRNS